MDLVSSQRLRLHARVPVTRPAFRLRNTAAAAALGMAGALASHYLAYGSWAEPVPLVVGIAIFGAFWYSHLEASGLAPTWSAALAALLVARLAWLPFEGNLESGGWWSPLGCGAFVYAMLWVLSLHEREPSLQALATAALVLSIGVLAKPPVIIACALVSLVIFLDIRRTAGGVLYSSLLLFTPALLCAGFLAVLNTLWGGHLWGAIWNPPSARLAPDLVQAPPYLSLFLHESAGLVFTLAVLLARLLERKTGSVDLAFLFVLSFLGVVGTFHVAHSQLTEEDFRLINSWGACCLLAVDPPRLQFARLVTIGGGVLALVMGLLG